MKKQHLNITKLSLNKKVIAQLEKNTISGGASVVGPGCGSVGPGCSFGSCACPTNTCPPTGPQGTQFTQCQLSEGCLPTNDCRTTIPRNFL